MERQIHWENRAQSLNSRPIMFDEVTTSIAKATDKLAQLRRYL